MGCVYEPYLAGTPNVAAVSGTVRWRMVSPSARRPGPRNRFCPGKPPSIGDPLYRPFGKSPQQLHVELTERHSPLDEWSYLRLVNLALVHGAPVRLARKLILKISDATTNSAVLTEKLADLYDSGRQTFLRH